MTNETRTTQLRQIVKHLASLPGSKSLDVIDKRLAHIGPAEAGTGYQVSTRTYHPSHVPESIHVAPDSDEIIVRLHGDVVERQSRDVLLERVHSLFASVEMRANWDVRTYFHLGAEPGPTYEMAVFSHLAPISRESIQ